MAEHEPGPYHVPPGAHPTLNRSKIMEQVIGGLIITVAVSAVQHFVVLREVRQAQEHQAETLRDLRREVHQMRRDLYVPRGSSSAIIDGWSPVEWDPPLGHAMPGMRAAPPSPPTPPEEPESPPPAAVLDWRRFLWS